MGRQMTRALLFGLVTCAYITLAVIKTIPLSRNFTTHLPSDLGDPLLTTWIMAWGTHALAHHPLSLFDANLLYPLDRTLAFSDHLLGVLPIFAPVYAATGNPIAAANTVFLLSFALSAFAAFCLTYMLTSAPWPSFLAGLLFGFAPFRFGQLSHLQLLNFFWCPLALLSLLTFLQTRRKAALASFGLFCCLQILSSVYLAFMTSVAVVVVVAVFAVAVDRSVSRWDMVGPALVCVAAMMVVLIPAHLPYLAVHRAWDATWSPRAMVAMSADLRSYVSPPPLSTDAYASLLPLSDRPGGNELRLFPGLVLPALALVGGLGTVRSVAAPAARAVRIIFGILCGVAIILSLGPYLVIPGTVRIPLPYLALHYAVPGWAGMRVPARFALLAVLAATPLAALGAIWIGERIAWSRRAQRWRAWIPAFVSLALAALFLGELGMKPLPLVTSPTEPEVPSVYSWLASTGTGPLLELPLDQPSDQRYSLLSTIHWRQIVNGRSGFMPPIHDDLREVLATFPAPRALQYAAAIGLGTIVVHAGRVSVDHLARLRVAEEAGSVHRVATFVEDLAYGIGDTSVVAASLSIDVAIPPVLPAERQRRLGLRVRATGGAAWVQRRPQGLSTVILEWKRDGGGRTIRQEVRVALPLVVTADEEIPLSLRAHAPGPGRYMLRVSIPAMGLVAPAQSVTVMAGGLADTGDRPGASLVAAYEVEHPSGQLQGSRATFMRLAVTAINQGEAIWLSNASRNGEMTLRIRWLGTRTSEEAVDSVVRLAHEVFPGQRYTFHLEIPLPVQPGNHILELGLASERAGPFASLGSDPLRLAVDVR